MALRSPIISVLGHVDHGKTTILDKIRGSGIAAKEAGLITQHVGASFVPLEAIKRTSGPLLEKYGFNLTIPGLLFVDTPGHEAFTTLRQRGGSASDLAVLVIDIMQGVQPQTKESIEILKANKVPFIVAANKIDLLNGWIPHPGKPFLETLKEQPERTVQELDTKLYEIVGQLGELGFNSERFDRVEDLTKNVLIIPVSGKTGEGFPELLLFLAGLSQKYMMQKLNIDTEKPGVGSILEVKEATGLGMTIDVILLEGKIKQSDMIAVASKTGPKIVKIKALLQPAPLEEIRDAKRKFKTVKEVHAAAGVKIAAPGLEDVIPGSPLFVVEPGKDKEAMEKVEKEMSNVNIKTEPLGIIVKADTLGSLEAICKLISRHGIKVRKAEVGPVNKVDLTEADSMRGEDWEYRAIFSFNQPVPSAIKEEAKTRGIQIFESNVIYRLEEEYLEWHEKKKKERELERLKKYVYPAKLKILEGYVFRKSKPAVVGVEVLEGMLKSDVPVMRSDGKTVGRIKGIQEEGKSKEFASKGEKVAVSIEDCTVGRQVNEGDILYTAVPREQAYEMIDKVPEKGLLKEIMRIKGD